MGSVRKMTYTGRDGKRKKTSHWYACYSDYTGKQVREKGFKDKAATLQLLARREMEAAQVRTGLRHPGSGDAARPLAELLELYEQRQRDLGLSDGHRRNCSSYLPEVFAACGWSTFADVTADALIAWGRRKLEGGGCSPATVNGFLSAVRAFARWAADRTGCPDPLARKVPKLNEEVDRRRSRRIPTPAELDALCRAAESARRRRGLVSGPDRAVLYRVAAYTGFRASELASLTPESFTVTDGVPTAVTVLAKDSKGGRTETVPVPAHLAAVLGPWLAARPAGELLWPGDWALNRGQWSWLRRDCKRAGIEPFPFHGFRSLYVTSVIEAGANVAELQAMARHRSAQTSLKHYARVKNDRLKALADLLPPPTSGEDG